MDVNHAIKPGAQKVATKPEVLTPTKADRKALAFSQPDAKKDRGTGPEQKLKNTYKPEKDNKKPVH